MTTSGLMLSLSVIVPTAITLPSFNDLIASIPIRRAHSMSSLKNGNTKNLIETESVFFITLMVRAFPSFYPVCSDILPPLSCPAKPAKNIPSSYLQKCPRDLASISPLVSGYSASQSTTSNGNANSWCPLAHLAAHPRPHGFTP